MEFLYPNLVPISCFREPATNDNLSSARPLIIIANDGTFDNEDPETLHVMCSWGNFGGVVCSCSLPAMGLSAGDVVSASVDIVGVDPNPRFGIRLIQYSGGVGGRWGWYEDASFADTDIGELSQTEWRTKESEKLTLGDVSARPWLAIAVISGVGFDVHLRHLTVQKAELRAWAPAEDEMLTGGGTLMSANLLDGITPKLLNGATYDGTAWLTPARTNTENTPTYYLEWPLNQARLTTNQTYRVAMGTMGDGGSGYLTAYLAYKDAAGNSNAVAAAIAYGTSWARSEATMVVPSGMTPYLLSICKWGKHPAVSVAGPVLNIGARGVPIAITSATLSWSAGILATIRYYQLASPTSATPAVPSSSSSLGSWTETEPEADVTKVLWTCERTVYADGTESWSKASKSTSYEAAKDAKGTATDAQQKAQEAQEQVVDVSTRLDQNTDNLTATIESKVAMVQQDVDATGDDVSDLSSRLSDEIKTRQSFMRFSEESSDPTLTLGQTDSPAQVKLTNKQLEFLYMEAVVAYISGDALLIRNATILQQLVLGGFVFVPRENGNLALKWVG